MTGPRVRQSGPHRSEQRVDEIRTLAGKLADATVLNTSTNRARCLEFAAQIVTLVNEEETYQRSLDNRGDDQFAAVRQQLADAMRGCIDAGEQAELTRLYVLSEHLQRRSEESKK